MKKLLKRMLALLACMMLALPAMAESVVVQDEEEAYNYIPTAAVAGDAAYLLRVDGMQAQLLRWTEGMDGAAVLLDRVAYASHYNSLEEIAASYGADGAEHAISCIFSAGEKLYALNHFNGKVFTIDVDGQDVAYTDVVTIRNLESLCSSTGRFNAPKDATVVGNWLMWYFYDREASRSGYCLRAYNLETGAVKQAVLPESVAMSPYKDGKVLVLGKAKDKVHALYSYDPANDEVETLTQLTSTSISGLRTLTYCAALDLVVYQDATRLLGWSEAEGNAQVGFIPTSYSLEKVFCMGDKILYSTTNNSGITTATLQKGYADARSLTIMNGSVNSVVSRFTTNWQGIPFYYITDHEADYEALLTGENAPDLIKFTVTDGDYMRLKEGGYLLDLSGYEELQAYADVLYPPYKELATKDGGVYGVPVYANSYNGWFINKKVMNEMGLTATDIPTDMLCMIEFAQKWNDEWAEKYPHYTLLNVTENYRHRFLEAILAEWEEYCQYLGQPLHYDEPAFRELLAALDTADFTKIDAALKQTDPEVSEYKQALIWTGGKDVGNLDSYMEESSVRIFLPIRLTQDTPYLAAVDNVQLWAVNAKSANADEAAAMLAALADAVDNVHAYVLRTDKTEPVWESNYDQAIAQQEKALAYLESRVEESANEETILQRIEELKQSIEQTKADRMYLIYPSAIQNYVEVIAPASVVMLSDLAADGYTGEICQCIDAYVAKEIDAETFIARMNEAVKAE